MDTNHIISKFGGIRPLARLLDCPVSTVQNWITRHSIPAWQQLRILEIGKKNGVEITPDDFFLPVKKPKKSKPN